MKRWLLFSESMGGHPGKKTKDMLGRPIISSGLKSGRQLSAQSAIPFPSMSVSYSAWLPREDDSVAHLHDPPQLTMKLVPINNLWVLVQAGQHEGFFPS